ncbi:MAG TPA: F-box protein [Gammaproteobacteria bacterium]|nr:F-box protein [Gammaproteobacteria bacterium]
MENRKLPLLNLPSDILENEIASKLDLITLSRIVRVNKRANKLFQKPFFNALLEKLADYIVIEPNEAKIKKIKKILDHYPEFLLKKIKIVINHTGRPIVNATPYQLAYGEGDIEMCEMLAPYFARACGSFEAGENERQKQIRERFSDINPGKGFDFKPIIKAIANEPFNHGEDENNKWILSEATLTAIETFRKDFDESQPKIINKGMHFRLETLKELYEEYARIAQQWQYDYKKCALLKDGVISFVLRYVPENDAQKFKQGLYYLQVKGSERENFKRSKVTRDGYNFRGALVAVSPDFHFLGCCVDIIFGWGGASYLRVAPAGSAPWFAWPPFAASSLAKFMSSKDFKLAELMQPANRRHQASPWCAIM